MRSASSSCRCASTPSLIRPGSTPSSCEESCRTSSIVMISCSPALLVTVQTSPSPSLRVHGGRHPVERLVGAVVRVHGQAAVGLDQQQPGGGRAGGRRAGPRSRRSSGRSRGAWCATLLDPVPVRRFGPGAGPHGGTHRYCQSWPVVGAPPGAGSGSTPTVEVRRPTCRRRGCAGAALRIPSGRPLRPEGVTRGVPMSLDVSPALLEAGRARRGRRTGVRRLRPDVPPLRVGDDQRAGRATQGRRGGLRRQPGAAAQREGARPAAPRAGERRDPRRAAAALRGAAGVPELPPGRGLPARPRRSTRATAGSPRSGPRCSTSPRSSATADGAGDARRKRACSRDRPYTSRSGQFREYVLAQPGDVVQRWWRGRPSPRRAARTG